MIYIYDRPNQFYIKAVDPKTVDILCDALIVREICPFGESKIIASFCTKKNNFPSLLEVSEVIEPGPQQYSTPVACNRNVPGYNSSSDAVCPD